MLLPRRIVEAARSAGLNPFAADAAGRVREASALAPLLGEIRKSVPGADPADVMLLLLQTLAVAQSESEPVPSAEFVATVPRGALGRIRPTSVVVREMITAARSRIVVLGYIVTEAGGLLELLQPAAARGVDIHVAVDAGGDITDELARRWPQSLPRPKCYSNAADSDVTRMHCKLIAVDRTDLLVTSANFTRHGLTTNVEFGIRVRGRQAGGADLFFDQLVRTGLLRRAEPAGRD